MPKLVTIPKNTPKSGIQTSEAIGGAGLISMILTFTSGGSDALQIVGIAAVAVLGAAYMISRGLAKK